VVNQRALLDGHDRRLIFNRGAEGRKEHGIIVRGLAFDSA